MLIESTLNRKEFTQHALTRHFQRTGFYVYAFVCAAITTYAILVPDTPPLLLVAGWLPFLVYSFVGWFSISRRSRDTSLPVYLPTRYELTKQALVVNSRAGRSEIGWEDFRSWRKLAGVYELNLMNKQVLVVSARAVAGRQVKQFEDLLKKYIQPKPEAGVFDK